jgi:hypothetical protein
MKQTMLLPVILLAIGALSCLAIKEGKRVPTPAEPAAPAAEEAHAA